MNEETTTAGARPYGEEAGTPRKPRPLLVGGYKGLSGNNYVVGEPDAVIAGADGEPAARPACAAIQIVSPRRCGHGETICPECAGSWVTGGWTLHFARTAGGRRLRDELGGEALAEMAARRAAGLDPAAVRAHQAMTDAVRAGERDRAPYRARPVRPPVAGDGASPYKRDLDEGSKGLSGSAYVVGELDTSCYDAGGAWVPGLERAAIRLRTPRRCDHCETVCTECAESWMYDWTFYFDRTAGGRRLRDEIGEEALAAMVMRRAAWEVRLRRDTRDDTASPASPASPGAAPVRRTLLATRPASAPALNTDRLEERGL